MLWEKIEPGRECAPRPGKKFVIIGGGFSGTVVFANLVERVPAGTTIHLFDANDAFAAGVAYGASDPHLLLNVPAGRMGAFAPEDFVNWLSTGPGKIEAALLGAGTGAADYLPRALYGRYLKHVLNRSLGIARRRCLSVRLVPAAIVDMRQRSKGLVLQSDDGDRHGPFDAVVLASGNCPPRAPDFAKQSLLRSDAYVAHLWAPPVDSAFPRRVGMLSKKDTVLILGSGLTAVDAALTLDQRGFAGRILAVSRHGLLPAAHATERPAPWMWRTAPREVPPSALAYLRWLRQEARAAAASGVDWRAIFEALRPITPDLWRRLNAREQKKLLRRHSLWRVHRHRMAPTVAARIEALKQSGRLECIPARIVKVSRWLGRFHVRLRRRGAMHDEVLKAKLILNCTGPDYALAENGNVLFRRLPTRSLVHLAANKAGLAIEPDGTVRSAAVGRIFAMGNLLVGDRFESTAVPELREQARWIAEQLATMAGAEEFLEDAA